IFEPMFTTKSTDMGLWICRAIVESYGGQLKSRSRIGERSIFQNRAADRRRYATRLTHYSMTSSANNRNDSGTVRPSPLAVFRFPTQTKFCRKLNGKVGRVCAPKDAIDVGRCFTHGLQLVNSIRHQPAALDVKAE